MNLLPSKVQSNEWGLATIPSGSRFRNHKDTPKPTGSAAAARDNTRGQIGSSATDGLQPIGRHEGELQKRPPRQQDLAPRAENRPAIHQLHHTHRLSYTNTHSHRHPPNHTWTHLHSHTCSHPLYSRSGRGQVSNPEPVWPQAGPTVPIEPASKATAGTIFWTPVRQTTPSGPKCMCVLKCEGRLRGQ